MDIKKLEDVVTWFDDWIEETKLDLTEEEMEDDEVIKEFETIKKVILESIDRIDKLETEAFSLRNQNILWQAIVDGYKKEKMEGAE